MPDIGLGDQTVWIFQMRNLGIKCQAVGLFELSILPQSKLECVDLRGVLFLVEPN